VERTPARQSARTPRPVKASDHDGNDYPDKDICARIPLALGCVETPAPTATSDVIGLQQVFLPAWVHATRQWRVYRAREGMFF